MVFFASHPPQLGPQTSVSTQGCANDASMTSGVCEFILCATGEGQGSVMRSTKRG